MVQASPKGHPPARGAPGWPGFVAAGPAEGQALASCLAFHVSLASRCWPWAGSSGLALCQFAPSSLWGLTPLPPLRAQGDAPLCRPGRLHFHFLRCFPSEGAQGSPGVQ